MPTLEILVLTVLAVVVVALIAIFRRERLARTAGAPSQIHPFRLGVYRGCAFVILVFVAYAVVMLILGAIMARG